MEREFFDDYDYPFYLITLIPVGKAGTGSRSLGGTGLTNSFSLCMIPETPLRGDFGQGLNVAALLAHEMFHQWDGQTILPVEPEQLCYWFTEGFTDFYMRRLLYRNGLASNEDYAAHVNKKLADLWTTEVRNAPNERILADFWKSDAVKRLPYVRGDVVAMIVDYGIRVHSNGKRSLDDLMRELVRDGKSHHGKVSTDLLLERFAKYAGPDVAAQVRSIIVEGTTPALAPDTFAPCFTVEEREITPFELGFDFAQTREARVITGLVPGSAAAQSGLQEGQKVGGWSVVYGDVSRPVVMTILENGERREIEYQPRGAAIRVPQIVAVPQEFTPAATGPPRCGGL
jgi:predicted metalloprotease with PDZ domain